MKFKFFGGKRYYRYGVFDKREHTQSIIKYYKKQQSNLGYKIEEIETGFWFPERKFILYFDKVLRIAGLTILCKTKSQAKAYNNEIEHREVLKSEA